jgi:hypothetical protein
MKQISPTPWAVVIDGENSPYVQRRIRTYSDHESSPVAWDVRNEADAHLISAAPEMLASLKEFHEFLNVLRPVFAIVGDREIMGKIGTIDEGVCAIIAKAEGRE